jgi:tetratricopeptide (TPR) repeat protein
MRRRLRDGRDGRAIVEDLERIGEALPPGPEKSHWFLELAVACEMLVPERQRALASYVRAVELDPGNGEAIDRGRMVCREVGRVDELIRLTEVDLQRETDEERRERLTALIGEALLDTGNRNRAAGFLVAAAGQFPASLTIQDALGTVGYDDDWRREVDRLIGIGDHADTDSGARVSLRAARILRFEAPEDERYEALLSRALEYDAYNESAFQLLDGLYASAERWDDLEQLQDRLVRAFPGREEQSALSQRFAFSWIARAQQDRAASWCWRAIELGGLVYPIAGLTLLRGIYGSKREWDKLLAAVDALLVTTLDQDAEVHTALLGGTIAWKAKRDLPRARAYFDRVRRVAIDSLLLIDFDDAEAEIRNPETLGEEQRALVEQAKRLSKSDATDRAIDAWRKAIAADAKKRAPRRGLARLLQRAERWRTLADALKDEEHETAADDGERVALLFQLAALYRDRLRQDLLLTQSLLRIVELQPGNLGALDQLETAYATMRRWPDVAATLEKKRAHATDEHERLALQLQLADLYQEKLNNESEAVKALEGAHALDGARDDIFQRLVASYTKRREWDKLFGLKRDKARALGEGEARLAAALELAQLATEKIKKPALAVEAWSEVLALAPQHDGALAALERLYAGEQAHARLAEIYARRAEISPDATTQLAYLTKLAQLCSTELNDAGRAIAAWKQVLAVSPGHGRALDLLKRLYLAERDWDALEGLLTDEKRLEECARLFEQKAQEETPPQVELLLRAGRIFGETLGRRDAAQRVYERVLTLDGKSTVATAALVRLYEEAGDARKLAHVLALEIEQRPLGEVAAAKARLLRLAGLHARELHDPAGAFAWQLRAFLVDPLDEKLRVELERLAVRVNGWAELTRAYQTVCRERNDVDRLALLSVVAREQETALGDVDGALATWQTLAALEPPPVAALAALARIYEARQAWRELHDVYARKLTLARDAEMRRPIVVAMAGLAERQGDDERAIADYRQLLLELGPDAATLAALERLYERAGNLDDVERVLVEWRALVTEPAERTALDFRLGEVRRRLGRVPDAITLYGEVLAAEPSHAGARAALEAIADGDEHALPAALLLEPILRATGASARLARILRIRINHASEVMDTVALMHELAWIEEHELGRRDVAFATLAQALKSDPAHTPTFDALERLSDGKWDRLATLYKEVAARPLNISEHVEVRCRLGALYRDRLHEPERALATFNRVLDLVPENAGAEAAIDALLAHSGRHVERADRLKAHLSAHPNDFTRLLKLAGLYERELGDAAQAARVYLEVAAADPDSREALAGLERLFAAGPTTLERAPIAALLLPRYRQAGRVTDAVRVWAAVPEALPVENLLAVAQEAGEVETLRAALGAAAARAVDPRARASVRRAHALLERDRGEAAAAESLLRLALTDWPEDVASLRALDGVLAAAGRAKDRVGILGRLAALAPVDDRQGILLQRGELQTQLGDVAGARATLSNALDLGEEARLLAALARLADDDAALALWQRLHAREPHNQEALAALAGLYERHERWRDLGEILEKQLADAPPEAMAPLLEQQALVWTRLDDAERAIATWRRLIALAPAATDALRGLARLYRARERHDELAEVLATLLDKLPRAEQLPVAVQLAELETRRQRTDAALTAWQRVLALDAHHADARDFLAQHGVTPPPAIDPAAAIAELAGRAAQASGAQRRELYLELGALHESAHELSQAVEAYRTVLPGVQLLDLLEQHAKSSRDIGQRLELYDALAEEAGRLERWARAVEATRRAAELEPSGAARAQRLYRAGLLCRDQLADFDEALACFEAAARNFGAAGTVAPQPLDDAIARLRARGARAAT